MQHKSKIFTILTLGLLLTAPQLALAGGVKVYPNVTDSRLEIGKNDPVYVQYDPDNTNDIQAIPIKRDDKNYVVALRWKTDAIRMYVYNNKGKELASEKIFKASDNKIFTRIYVEAITENDKKYILVNAIKTDSSHKPEQRLVKKYQIKPTKDSIIQGVDSKSYTLNEPAATGNDTTDSINYYNYLRGAAGILPAKRVGSIDEGCVLHSEYMRLNNDLTHYEEEGKPGYTAEGDLAGGRSNVTRQLDSSTKYIVTWLTETFYHRIGMYVPGLRKVGYALSSPGTDNFRFGCFDITTGYDTNFSGNKINTTYYDPENFDYIVYPGVGQSKVPTTLHPGEYPDPLENYGGTYPAGYAVSITFGAYSSVRNLNMVLLHPNGQELAGYFNPPGESDDPYEIYQGNSAYFIAEAPLASKTTYTAHVTGIMNGENFSTEWQFTTE